MKVEFVPLSENLLPACKAFNNRLRSFGEPPFLAPEQASPLRSATPHGIRWNQFVAVDDAGAVRGAVLLMEQRGWIGGREISLINIQSPLSEGMVDRAYSGVSLRMLHFLVDRSQWLYAVGMGGEGNPFARLLSAAGWRVGRNPFQFAVIRAARVLREIGPLRQGWIGTLARFAAASGLGSAAARVWRMARENRPPLRGHVLEIASVWPEELDEIWQRCRHDLSFSVVRDFAAVRDLHPTSDDRLKRYVLRTGGRITGWSVGLVTQMRANSHFGDLKVGTILDALAPTEDLGPLLALTFEALTDLGADLIISNQTHARWQQQFRRLGFFDGPSNYLIALSKPLASGIVKTPGAFEHVYISRGDGDGRIHL